MTHLIDKYGGKTTILIGLLLQALQLLLLGFFTNSYIMWLSGIIASISSITYPAISAYISAYSDADKQGLVQGVLTGVRSLCGGIGPAMFGLLFYIYNIDVYEEIRIHPYSPNTAQNPARPYLEDVKIGPVLGKPPQAVPTTDTLGKYRLNLGDSFIANWVVGPPFLFGAILVLLAAMIATFIPDNIMSYRRNSLKSSSPPTNYYRYTTVQSSNGNFENGVVDMNDDANLLDYECHISQSTIDH